MRRGPEATPLGDDPIWYKDAVICFSLEPQRVEEVRKPAGPVEALLPIVTVAGEWSDLFERPKDTTAVVLNEPLLGHIRSRRWFGGKARQIRAAEVQDAVPLPLRGCLAYLVLVQVSYSDGEPETYLLPLAFASGEAAQHIRERSPEALVARLAFLGRDEASEGLLYDATADTRVCSGLLEAVAQRRRFRGAGGEVAAWPTPAFPRLRGAAVAALEPTLLRGEQSNSSVIYGGQLILKLFRRLWEGTNPDLEIGRFLTEKAPFPNVPPVAGALEYRRRGKHAPVTVGLLQGYVQNQGDAWRYTLDVLSRYFESVLAHAEAAAPPVSHEPLLALSATEPPALAQEAIGPYLEAARLLGQRTAELHLALASETEDPAFVPEPFSDLYRRALYHGMLGQADHALHLLGERLNALPVAAQADAATVLERGREVSRRLAPIRGHRITALRIRCHGDYHLGQVLYTGKDFVIIDFEGEPARSLSERRRKRLPLQDLAGMLRSFHYAAAAALSGQPSGAMVRPEDRQRLEPWARYWHRWVGATFLRAYLATAGPAPFLPRPRENLTPLLDAYLLEKALYELAYELNNRPDWVSIPLQGILQLLDATG